MAAFEQGSSAEPRPRRSRPRGQAATSAATDLVHDSVLGEAGRLGLLSGNKSKHVSFRVSPELLEAAKRASGVTSISDLGELALAMLAQPDPVAVFLRNSKGRLGKDHSLEY